MQIGLKALEAQFGIRPVQPLRVESAIGRSRTSRESAERIQNLYAPVYRPADTFAGHFEFGLKYEEIHLEFFARLFAACGPGPLEQWCHAEPFGQYARRAGFFYEWLTGQRLGVPDLTRGTYVDALSNDRPGADCAGVAAASLSLRRGNCANRVPTTRPSAQNIGT